MSARQDIADLLIQQNVPCHAVLPLEHMFWRKEEEKELLRRRKRRITNKTEEEEEDKDLEEILEEESSLSSVLPFDLVCSHS